MIIMAIDPGGTTGWCVIETPFNLLAADQFRNSNHIITIEMLLDKYKPDVVVVESFHLYPWMAKTFTFQQLPVAELIGKIEYVVTKRGIVLHKQPASARKIIKRKVLEATGIAKHLRGKQHARDAVMHALAYSLKKNPSEFACALEVYKSVSTAGKRKRHKA